MSHLSCLAYADEVRRLPPILQGFRKIDTDRWEFANECFVRGKRHLLKNIQRRRSATQSQQLPSYYGGGGGSGSPSGESSKLDLSTEVEKLRKEKSLLMQEVVELQQQHRGTADRVEVVKQRLQASEQRQKQMVSFLAKIFQNPAFVERLRQMKAQRELESSRMRRKFVKQKQQEGGSSSVGGIEGQIVKFGSELPDIMVSQGTTESTSQDYLLQDLVGNFSTEMYFPLEEEPTTTAKPDYPLLKGKGLATPRMEVTPPDHFVSFPEELAQGRGFTEFPPPGTESLVKQEEVLSMGLDVTAGMSASGIELWQNVTDYDMPDIGPSGSGGGFSDIWDLGSGVEKWVADEAPVGDPESKDDSCKDVGDG